MPFLKTYIDIIPMVIYALIPVIIPVVAPAEKRLLISKKRLTFR
jgi:hypothetical protein